jgi:NhaA family Na+:H+ antiporter
VERFLAVEASSGIVLLGAAVVALVWANTSARPFYEALWHTPFGLRLGDWSFERDLHFWINDGLMTLFFFVVGLEIRREIHRGELSELRRAALPLAAAAGGMAVPAALYLLVNGGRPSAVGWGVPMATDIAFAVGVLALLGKRVPPALRILLLALAVIDDVGAILVIAIFYTSGLAPLGLGVMAAAVALVITLQRFGVRAPLAYAPAALFVWAGAYAAGIHPTLAGVVMGLLTPARAWFGGAGFVASAEANLRSLREKGSDDEHEMLADLDEIDGARREAVSPVARLIHALHGWVAFGVMPLFALANAGVPLGDAKLTGDGLRVFVGVTLGLVIGKPAGVLGLSWLAARVGLVKLPTGIGWRQVVVVGLAAGIGFTMALFIAQLAFPPGPLLETSKLAILVGSVLGGLAAYAAGRRILTTSPIAGAASSESDAESATHA